MDYWQKRQIQGYAGTRWNLRTSLKRIGDFSETFKFWGILHISDINEILATFCWNTRHVAADMSLTVPQCKCAAWTKRVFKEVFFVKVLPLVQYRQHFKSFLLDFRVIIICSFSIIHYDYEHSHATHLHDKVVRYTGLFVRAALLFYDRIVKTNICKYWISNKTFLLNFSRSS